MKHYKSVHAIIIYKRKYFIQKRDNKKNIHFPNFWGLFGGKIAQNESKINAILRELKEEKLDFGILATPLSDPQIYESVLYYEPFRILFHKNNKLLKKDSIKIALICSGISENIRQQLTCD